MGRLGELRFLGDAIGLPAGAVVLDGGTGAGDVSLVFELELAPQSAPTIGPYVAWIVRGTDFVIPTALGWIPGSEPDALADLSFATGTIQGLEFASLQPGQTSDAFFASFAEVRAGDVVNFTYTQLIGSPPSGAQLIVIPEPASAALVAAGLLLLLAHRR